MRGRLVQPLQLIAVLTFAVAAHTAVGAGGRGGQALRSARLDPHNRALLAGHADLGPRLEIVVSEDGLYRISKAELDRAGFPLAGVDPRRLALTSQGEDIAVRVEGEDDGRFDEDDSLVFVGRRFRGDRLAALYGEAMRHTGAVDNWLWQCSAGCGLAGLFEKYTNDRTYWLRVATGRGLRLAAVPPGPPALVPSRGQVAATMSATRRFEESRRWWSFNQDTEDTWFWDDFTGALWPPGQASAGKPITRAFPFTLTDLSSASASAALGVALAPVEMAMGEPDYHASFVLNGVPVGTHTWDGRDRQVYRGQVAPGVLRNGANTLEVSLLPEVRPGQPVTLRNPDLYLDWIEVTYDREILAVQDQVVLDAPATGVARIPGFASESVRAFDVRVPSVPVPLGVSVEAASRGYVAHVAVPGGSTLVAYGASSVRPARLAMYTPPRWPTRADYVIIAPRDYHRALQPLARHRAAGGLSVVTLDPGDLYREFNHGVPHPIAIKNFLAWAFDAWDSPPRYVFLVGAGHWNLKGFPDYPAPAVQMPPNLAFVDPWQGEVDSTNLLATLVGDDTLPDVHIGRLPAASVAEVETYVRKVVQYEGIRGEAWQQEWLVVADNVPDPGGDFELSSEQAIKLVARLAPDLHPQRTYLTRYGCKATDDPGCRKVTEDLVRSIDGRGARLVVYQGHASADYWTHERVLRSGDIPRLKTPGHWPVLVSMTCLDGYWIDPRRRSIVTEMLVAPGGLVGALSPMGLGLAATHDHLLEGFLTAYLRDSVVEIGELARRAKAHLHKTGFRPDLLHTYSVFGDPALKLPSGAPATREAVSLTR